ncbi:hypothetical protein BCU68_12370 [Vibrio sp. 10N.286.49.B3]|uniref:hypothetical protein n=1 Tax=Vibrio sp. 10N.286.49.B3 TaxID=1880855 RepID=UPI000C833848|nr:hypothetical protein [Vibrio sp. 10N.286.49.B3]PMH44636.1 hypothetical protein BCU68_12370 [Vibrio sp. 10N.286.49.B3]
MRISQIIPILITLILSGCFLDNEPEAITNPDNAKLALGEYDYTTREGDEGVIATINYNVTLEAESPQDVMVDIYLLPILDNNSTEDSSELDPDEYSLLTRVTVEQMPPGLNSLSLEVPISDLKHDIGEYEIVPVLNPLELITGDDFSNNLPSHIGSSEPQTSDIDGAILVNGTSIPAEEIHDNVSVLLLEEQHVYEDIVNVDITSDEPTVIINYTKYDYNNEPLVYFYDSEITGDVIFQDETLLFEIDSQTSEVIPHTYYLTAQATITNQTYPLKLKLWNKTEQQYCSYQEIDITSTEEAKLGYAIEVYDMFNEAFGDMWPTEDAYDTNYFWGYIAADLAFDQLPTNEALNFSIQFNLIKASDLPSDIACDEVIDTEPAFSNQLSLVSYFFEDPSLLDINGSDNRYATKSTDIDYELLSFDKSFKKGDEDKFQAVVGTGFEVKYKADVDDEDEDEIKAGIFSETNLVTTVFDAENELITLNGEVGLTGANTVGYTFETSVLGFVVYSSSPEDVIDCNDTTCQEDKKFLSFDEEWEKTAEASTSTFLIGPVPVKISAGVTGTLEFNTGIGINEEYGLFVGAIDTSSIIAVDFDGYLKGGIDLALIYAGAIGQIDVVETSIGSVAYIRPWDNVTSGITAQLDLELIKGQVGAYADVKAFKWCSKKIWGKSIKYICGKETKKYTFWIYNTPALYEKEGYELFDVQKNW